MRLPTLYSRATHRHTVFGTQCWRGTTRAEVTLERRIFHSICSTPSELQSLTLSHEPQYWTEHPVRHIPQTASTAHLLEFSLYALYHSSRYWIRHSVRGWTETHHVSPSSNSSSTLTEGIRLGTWLMTRRHMSRCEH